MTLCALGGAPLQGDRLVRLAYFDESGMSSKTQEPWVVVGGALVHGDHQLTKLELALEAIVNEHIPEGDRDNFVLHAGEIYGGYGKYFDKKRNPEWEDWERRAAILDDLAKVADKANVQIVFAGVEKERWGPPKFTYGPNERPNLLTEMHVTAFVVCAVEVELWLRQHARQEHCMMIVEDNKESRSLISSTQRFYQDRKLTQALTEDQRKLFPLRKIKEDPAFQKKRAHHPLVLADFISFTVKRKYMNDPRIDRFCRPWWKRGAGLQVQLPS